MALLLVLFVVYGVFGATYYVYRRGIIGDLGLIAIPVAVMAFLAILAAPYTLPPQAKISDSFAELLPSIDDVLD
jgi:hypothetical protein